tara:strand:+ start:2876 stop:3097 length:222 start_codon:yes stop_codon:yes gene_type:complete
MPNVNIYFHPNLDLAGRRLLISSKKRELLSQGLTIEKISIQKENCPAIDHPVDDYTLSLADSTTFKVLSDGTN